MTERVYTSRSNEDPTYYCDLCDAEFEMKEAFNHVTSVQHRFLFLVLLHSKFKNLKIWPVLIRVFEQKATRASLISDLIDANGDLVSSGSPQIIRVKLSESSAKLESEIGRGNPKIMVGFFEDLL